MAVCQCSIVSNCKVPFGIFKRNLIYVRYFSRKGKSLDLEEIKHYCRMASALKETIATQKKIDAAYNDVEKGIMLERITG